MEAVWNWIVERHIPVSVMSYHGVVGRILRAMEDWVKANRSPDSERRADFREIARIASLLARKVRKYRGEIVGFHELPGLVSEEYEQVLSKFLHPDLVRQPKYSLRVYLRSFLPPIEDVLERMAARAKENSAALTSTFPKKIRAKSAYRTFIVRACTDITFSSTGCYSPSIVAALASVVLDDTGITADTVRKVAADLVGNAKGRAEDSAGKSGE
jgi:hypothetical protein